MFIYNATFEIIKDNGDVALKGYSEHVCIDTKKVGPNLIKMDFLHFSLDSMDCKPHQVLEKLDGIEYLAECDIAWWDIWVPMNNVKSITFEK